MGNAGGAHQIDQSANEVGPDGSQTSRKRALVRLELQGGSNSSPSPRVAWLIEENEVDDQVDYFDPAETEAKLDDIEWEALDRFRQLSVSDQERYLQLGAYPPADPIPRQSLVVLWRYNNASTRECSQLLDRLVRAHLLISEGDCVFIPGRLLHVLSAHTPQRGSRVIPLPADVSSDNNDIDTATPSAQDIYASLAPARVAIENEVTAQRRKGRTIRRQHRNLLRAYRATLFPGEYRGGDLPWHNLRDDGYILSRLTLHIVLACEFDLLMNLLFDMRWLATRLRHDGPQGLLHDIDLYLAATENLVSPVADAPESPSRLTPVPRAGSPLSTMSTSWGLRLAGSVDSQPSPRGPPSRPHSVHSLATTTVSPPRSPGPDQGLTPRSPFEIDTEAPSLVLPADLGSSNHSPHPLYTPRSRATDAVPASVRSLLHGKTRSRKTLQRASSSRNNGYAVQNEAVVLLKHALLICADELVENPAQLTWQLTRSLKNYSREYPELRRLLDRSRWSVALLAEYERNKVDGILSDEPDPEPTPRVVPCQSPSEASSSASQWSRLRLRHRMNMSRGAKDASSAPVTARSAVRSHVPPRTATAAPVLPVKPRLRFLDLEGAANSDSASTNLHSVVPSRSAPISPASDVSRTGAKSPLSDSARFLYPPSLHAFLSEPSTSSPQRPPSRKSSPREGNDLKLPSIAGL